VSINVLLATRVGTRLAGLGRRPEEKRLSSPAQKGEWEHAYAIAMHWKIKDPAVKSMPAFLMLAMSVTLCILRLN
jgi:hypothetical protein